MMMVACFGVVDPSGPDVSPFRPQRVQVARKAVAMPRKAASRSAPMLSLAEAARLTNMPKPYLKELVERGVVAAHVLDKGGTRKLRISPAALAAAGLVGRTEHTNGTGP